MLKIFKLQNRTGEQSKLMVESDLEIQCQTPKFDMNLL